MVFDFNDVKACLSGALNVLSLYFFLGFEEVTLKMSKSEEPLHFNY